MRPARTSAAETEARIKRIANGLLPLVRIKGEPAKTRTLKQEMERLKVPGSSIAVIHRGKIEWARGFGVTRLGGLGVTPKTVFQAGSISKPVAAMAALKLVEEGELNLDEDVNTKLSSWKVPENEFTRQEKVTLRRLLSHTAGLTVQGFPGYAVGETVPTLVQVLNGEKPANTGPVRVDATPGKAWRYSGGGFTVVQQLMTDVLHKRFSDIMRDKVLRPLGMTHSTYEEPLSEAKLAQAATPYYGNYNAVPGGPHTYPEMAAAGLWTTPSDLARFIIAVQDGLAGRRNSVLSQGMLRQMVMVQMAGWGLGVGVGGEGEKAHFAHGGSDAGFEAFLFGYKSTGNGAVIMTNASGGGILANEIMRAIAQEYGWPDFQQEERTEVVLDAKALEAFTGTYEFERMKISVSVRNGMLYASNPTSVEIELHPATPTRFFGVYQGVWYEFVPGESGAMTMIIGGMKGTRVK